MAKNTQKKSKPTPPALRRRRMVFAAFFFFLLIPSMACPVKASEIVCPFQASSAATLLLEADSGRVLYRHSARQRMQPASLAKVMTLFLIFDALEKGDVTLEEEVTVSQKAAQKQGSTMYLKEDEKIPLSELIKGIAVVSGNDACIAAAEKISGNEQVFVERMNQKAEALGLKDTRFQTADGWPAQDQFTTAYDMAMLAHAYIRAHPEALDYHRLREFTHADIVLHNRNGLLAEDPTVDGLKTGHVEEAGYHLIATAERKGRRCIAVAMGADAADTRESEARQLLDYGFTYYTTVTLFRSGEVLAHIEVSKGQSPSVSVHPAEDGVLTVPLWDRDLIAYEIVSPGRVQAPVEENQQLGHVSISRQKEVLQTIPLLAGQNVPVAGKTAQALEFIQGLGNSSLLTMALFLAVLVVVIGCQVLYIARLRKRLKNRNAPDAEVVKQRLDHILKSN
jgi:D-alanyl-D-alanine carboxypeptidase (penicillin-binding protein 5/6)